MGTIAGELPLIATANAVMDNSTAYRDSFGTATR